MASRINFAYWKLTGKLQTVIISSWHTAAIINICAACQVPSFQHMTTGMLRYNSLTPAALSIYSDKIGEKEEPTSHITALLWSVSSIQNESCKIHVFSIGGESYENIQFFDPTWILITMNIILIMRSGRWHLFHFGDKPEESIERLSLFSYSCSIYGKDPDLCAFSWLSGHRLCVYKACMCIFFVSNLESCADCMKKKRNGHTL